MLEALEASGRVGPWLYTSCADTPLVEHMRGAVAAGEVV